ncbi:FAD:protein FMN transferase [Periweissella ghanensis]|uniref:FAD:protein FMN transferase n=1 Tax=Periweissella ghanensis TaxID=467997 RepID=A0ABN8BNI0_9LACO|nr:FAD:protein FMN transferase [Periweissella ghanensis]CAH0417840.1 FAD:protein FMN transferase [Periweissella ghanensis]
MIKIEKTWHAMGTTNQLTLFGTQQVNELDATIALVNHYEDLLTVNRAQSAVMSVNQAAGDHPVAVPPIVYQLIKRAVYESQQHFGFNAAIGPLVNLWHIGFADAQVPSDAAITQARQKIVSDGIILDDDALTVYLPVAGMALDLGAIAKGYIADRVKDYWQAQGQMAGIINFGGNIVLLNAAPHNDDGRWTIGVRDPLVRHGEAIALLTTPAMSIVTSGVAERHLVANGQTYHHIIDPETGYPHDNELASVTVLSPKSIDGEVETTRLFFNDGPIEADDYPFGAIFIYRDRSIRLVNINPADFKIIQPTFYIKEA